jgi:hypothetical protein
MREDLMEWTFRPIDRWPRELTAKERQRGKPFAADYNNTVRLLDGELRKLRATDSVVQLALGERNFRADGLLRGDAQEPSHPGVILSFGSRHGPLKYVCDDCRNWPDNLRAIALTLERLRLADLYGVTRRGEQYAGWKALPAPLLTPPMTLDEAAAFVAREAAPLVGQINDADLRLRATNVGTLSVIEDGEVYRELYRVAAGRLHPTRTTEVAGWQRLQEAKAVLDAHHAARAIPKE